MQGQIVDSATNKPLAGAVITVDSVLNATTDENGKFKIDKVPSGILDYSIQADGYQVVSASGNAEPGKPFELNLAMQAKPPQ
jgi:Carboxypeptidase regulatory-like domain